MIVVWENGTERTILQVEHRERLLRVSKKIQLGSNTQTIRHGNISVYIATRFDL